MRALFLLAGLLYALALGRDQLDAWVARTELPVLVQDLSVETRGHDGTLLRAYTVADGLWRLDVALDRVDPGYIEMLLAFEDQRFRDHSGVDLWAVARAVGQGLRYGRVVSGGSTLTMQVARLLERSGTGAWTGKLRQVRVALALEHALTKDQILNLYLTLAPYGANIEGVRAATLVWFGKEPHRLSPAEAALLVALPQSPTGRRPDRFPQAALVARNRVLSRATEAGMLSPEQRRIAGREALPQQLRPFPQLAPHLADRVRRAAPERVRHDLSVNADWQAKLETLAGETVRSQGADLSAAIMVVEHGTGLIRASVGSAGYADDRRGYVDMTQALRSPGSTLKPLVYGLAFDSGRAHPETLIEDRPVAFGSYTPQNFDRTWRGTITLRGALQASLNIPVVTLTDAIGPARLMAGMRHAGMDPVLPGGAPGLAVALGGVGVTLHDLVALYAGIASGGTAVQPGWSPETASVNGTRFLSAASAWQIGDILRGVPPPAHAAQGLAFKTGTSYGHRDAWAIGYDGAHVVGVWLGRPDGTPVPGAFGADIAAPMLFAALQQIKDQFQPAPPPPPETLMVETAALPVPLQRFGGARQPQQSAPQIAFPPNGAILRAEAQMVTLKLRGGRPPFTILADGAPVLARVQRREIALPLIGPGFVTLQVIDARGGAARTQFELR